MPELVANPLAKSEYADTKRHLIAAFLSALVPGAGQLLLGQKRKGYVLLVSFVALCACLWPLRLPRFFLGLIASLLAWLGLCIYAVCAALLNDPRVARWWLLIAPPLVYLCLNLVFTPILLLGGFRAVKFGSSSMEPTLPQGDCFLVDLNYYRHRPVLHDDLVVLREGDYQTVKRVIAVGGETIEGKDRTVLLNGQALNEPFIQHELPIGSNPQLDTFDPVTLKDGKYFVMGDNRDVSLDSRTLKFGLVNAQAILGKPLYIYRSHMKGRAGKQLR
jgi:signal peptidase I